MKKELELKLVKKYPNLYQEYGGDMARTCMHWGFCCGDGWYKLIDELSSKLEPLGVVAAQVKEKFGGLRFYTNAMDEDNYEEAQASIRETEHKSYETCEVCGKPGKIRGKQWLRTLCDQCDAKEEDENE